MALIVTDALKFRESENDQFRRLSLSANFNTPVPVSQGGTGATTAAQAAKNLNVLPLGEVVTKIPSGADLNNYTTPGVYAVHSTAIAQTLMNKPVDMAGTLRVFCSNGADINSVSSKYLIQEYTHLQGPKYYRFGASEAGAAFTWDAWQAVGAAKGIWTPTLYDYNTYKRDMPSQVYFKIGKLYVLFLYESPFQETTFSTMIQFRNAPCQNVCGGTVYVANIGGQGGTWTVQGSGPSIYLRPNYKGTISGGIFQGVFFGFDS